MSMRFPNDYICVEPRWSISPSAMRMFLLLVRSSYHCQMTDQIGIRTKDIRRFVEVKFSEIESFLFQIDHRHAVPTQERFAISFFVKTQMENVPSFVTSRIQLNCFTETGHCSFKFIDQWIFISQQRVSVIRVRCQLNGTFERLDRFVIFMIQTEAITRCAPTLEEWRIFEKENQPVKKFDLHPNQRKKTMTRWNCRTAD